MRKMSHLKAAEGTEMSHPGPPVRRTGGPSCWKYGSVVSPLRNAWAAVTWPKVVPIQGAHIQPLPEASGAFQGLCKGTGQAMLQRSPWGWLKQLDPS